MLVTFLQKIKIILLRLKTTIKSDTNLLFFYFLFTIQLLPDQATLLNRTKAEICNPLENLQSAYKTILVSDKIDIQK